MEEITNTDQLDAALRATADRPAFFFKHSTACPVSAGALRRAREFFDHSRATGANLPTCHLINVIESRPLSNALAQRLNVEHKSPQILLVDHARALWHTSHFDINAETIGKALDAHAAKR